MIKLPAILSRDHQNMINEGHGQRCQLTLSTHQIFHHVLEFPIQQRLHIWLMNRIKHKLESIETTMDCNHENSSSNTMSQPYQIFEKRRVLFWSYGIQKSRENASPVQWSRCSCVVSGLVHQHDFHHPPGLEFSVHVGRLVPLWVLTNLQRTQETLYIWNQAPRKLDTWFLNILGNGR